MREDALVLTTNPFQLFALAALIVIAAWLCARSQRNTNDFLKSVKLFLPAAVVLSGIFWATGLALLLCIGCCISGFVALMLFSNHYFYH